MEIRFQPDQPVHATVSSSQQKLTGSIVHIHQQVATLRFDEPVPIEASVRLDFEDSILRTETASCLEDGGSFLVRLKVVDVTPILSDLGRLVTAVMNASKMSAAERTSILA